MLNEIINAIASAASWMLPFDCMEPLFMKRSLLAVMLIAPLASMAGIQVVNSRLAFFSDAIGHSAFAGVAIGLIFAFSPDVTQPALAVLVGVLIMYLRRGTRLSSDTVIGVIFSAVAAAGLAIVSRNKEAARNVQTFLFGDVLTIDDGGILSLAILFVLFCAFLCFAYNRMIVISVNPQLAAVHKIRVAAYQYCFAALLALVVIYSVRAVGVILVTALLIVPAAAARNFARNTSSMFWLSLLFGVVSGVAGLLLSAQDFADAPTGAMIVLVSTAIFCVSTVYSFLSPSRTSDTEK